MGLNFNVPYPARRYDYLCGGKDNMAADRQSAHRIAQVFPTVRLAALQNRAFLRRVVTYLARQHGVRQFLDIGAGLPSAPNVHDLAQLEDRTARVVYVDRDPMVPVHGRGIMSSTPQGRIAHVLGDLRRPEAILTDPLVQVSLDWTQPVGLLLLAVLHFITDPHEPHHCVRTLLDAMPAGSFMAISHVTGDYFTPDVSLRIAQMATDGHDGPFQPRSHAEISRFFDGGRLLAPGLVPLTAWPGPDPGPAEDRPPPTPAEVAMYGGVAQL